MSLSVAGYPYDQVAAILDGSIAIDQCKVDFEISKIGELNQHVFSGPQTRDVTEVGLIPYLLAFCNEEGRPVATFKGQVEYNHLVANGKATSKDLIETANTHNDAIKREYEAAIITAGDERQSAIDELRPYTDNLLSGLPC